MDITVDAVKLVAQKLSGDSGPGGTDSEALEGVASEIWGRYQKTAY